MEGKVVDAKLKFLQAGKNISKKKKKAKVLQTQDVFAQKKQEAGQQRWETLKDKMSQDWVEKDKKKIEEYKKDPISHKLIQDPRQLKLLASAYIKKLRESPDYGYQKLSDIRPDDEGTKIAHQIGEYPSTISFLAHKYEEPAYDEAIENFGHTVNEDPDTRQSRNDYIHDLMTNSVVDHLMSPKIAGMRNRRHLKDEQFEKTYGHSYDPTSQEHGEKWNAMEEKEGLAKGDVVAFKKPEPKPTETDTQKYDRKSNEQLMSKIKRMKHTDTKVLPLKKADGERYTYYIKFLKQKARYHSSKAQDLINSHDNWLSTHPEKNETDSPYYRLIGEHMDAANKALDDYHMITGVRPSLDTNTKQIPKADPLDSTQLVETHDVPDPKTNIKKTNKLPGGLADGLTDKDFTDKENKAIKEGTKLERKEHGSYAPKEIAQDHVHELGEIYYDKNKGLPSMEEKLEKAMTPDQHFNECIRHQKIAKTLLLKDPNDKNAKHYQKMAIHHWKESRKPGVDYKPTWSKPEEMEKGRQPGEKHVSVRSKVNPLVHLELASSHHKQHIEAKSKGDHELAKHHGDMAVKHYKAYKDSQLKKSDEMVDPKVHLQNSMDFHRKSAVASKMGNHRLARTLSNMSVDHYKKYTAATKPQTPPLAKADPVVSGYITESKDFSEPSRQKAMGMLKEMRSAFLRENHPHFGQAGKYEAGSRFGSDHSILKRLESNATEEQFNKDPHKWLWASLEDGAAADHHYKHEKNWE